MPALRFEKPANWSALTPKQKIAARKAWRNLPATRAARKAERAAAKAKTAAFFKEFVIQPVEPLLRKAVQTALDEGLDGDDLVDDVTDWAREKLDDLAAFEALKKIPAAGTALAGFAEAASDAMIAGAIDHLEIEIREVLAEVLAERGEG